MDLSTNIKYPANLELQKIMHKTFVDILLAESGKEGDNLNRLTSKAVYLLCWLKRYLPFFIFQLEDAGDRMFYPYGRVPE